MSALIESSGFVVALLTASGVALVAVVLARGPIRSVALGLAAVSGAFAGLAAEGVLPGALLVAVLLVAAGALAARGRPLTVSAAASIPGGVVLVTLAASGTPGWARALVFAAVLVAIPTSETIDGRFALLSFALIAFSSLGVYGTVPDTEQARSVVGALLPVAAVAVVWRRSGEGAGPGASVALVAWVGLVGGVGRPGSVVGAIGCLGVLALGPLIRRSSLVRLVSVHVVVVVLASRVAGFRESAWVALAIAVPVMVIGAFVVAAGARGRTPDPP